MAARPLPHRRSIQVLVPVLAASLLCAVPAGAERTAAEASDRYTRECRYEAAGIPLRIRLTVQFASAGSDDIKRISVRATDDDETGAFGNSSVQLTSALVKVNGPDDQATTLNKSFKSSPFTTSMKPTGNGKDAARATTIVTWNLPKKRKASLTCFYVDQ